MHYSLTNSLFRTLAILAATLVLGACATVDRTVDATVKYAAKAVDVVTPDFIFPDADEVEPDESDAAAEAMKKIDPKIQRRYEAALAEMRDGELTRAISAFEEFIIDYPEYPGASLNLAKLQLRNQQPDAAINTLNMVLSLHPKYAAAYNQLGIIYREQGEFDKAADAYSNAIDVDPDYALAYFNLGVLNDLYKQQPAVALDYYQQYRQRLAPGAEDPEVDRWIRDLERRAGTAQASQTEGAR